VQIKKAGKDRVVWKEGGGGVLNRAFDQSAKANKQGTQGKGQYGRKVGWKLKRERQKLKRKHETAKLKRQELIYQGQ